MTSGEKMLAPLTPGERQGNTGFAVHVSLLVLRLALGAVFIYHGSGKLFGAFGGPGIEMWTKIMESMQLPVLPPAAWAYMSACGEFFGGVFVFLGLLGRFGALNIIITMIVAIVTATGKNGFDNGNHGYEFNLVLIAMGAVILIAGPGLLSADAYLFRRGLWAWGPQPLSNPTPRQS